MNLKMHLNISHHHVFPLLNIPYMSSIIIGIHTITRLLDFISLDHHFKYRKNIKQEKMCKSKLL